jgi:hypothetical protein
MMQGAISNALDQSGKQKTLLLGSDQDERFEFVCFDCINGPFIRMRRS